MNAVGTQLRDPINSGLTRRRMYGGFIMDAAAELGRNPVSAIRQRVSPEFIGSRNCVPMAFTAESPPAQGQ